MKTKEHGNLTDQGMAGNGYHGRCEYCGLALVTDLGYNSWANTKCKPREIVKESDVPEKIRSLARFHGMRFAVENGVGVYVKAYDRAYTLEELQSRMTKH